MHLPIGIWTNYGVFEKALSLTWVPDPLSTASAQSDGYGDPVVGSYIANYPPGAKTVDFVTLAYAQAACNILPESFCGGITLQGGSYQIRQGSALIPNPPGSSNATSWLRESNAAVRFATRR